jgi:hypothetical protein
MNRIAISAAAYAAIVADLPEEARGVEPERTVDGRLWVWLPRPLVDALAAARGPRESYSDVIIRLARLASQLDPKEAP